MPAPPESSPADVAAQVRMGLQFVLGVAVFAYGVGRLTDVISYELPAAVYLVAGVGLLAYAVLLLLRE